MGNIWKIILNISDNFKVNATFLISIGVCESLPV